MIITIDGPAGSGKSTVAKLVACKLGIKYLDTGATYRSIAYIAIEKNLENNIDGLLSELKKSPLEYEFDGKDFRVKFKGEDITDLLRTEKISELASKLAANSKVRDYLIERQRAIGRDFKDFVSEGRDQGSVVFPDADLKIYLDADLAERARRRHKELLEKNQPVSYKEVLESLRKRDERDMQRSVDPLIVPEDSVVIDTTNMDIEEVANRIIELTKNLGSSQNNAHAQ